MKHYNSLLYRYECATIRDNWTLANDLVKPLAIAKFYYDQTI